VATVFEVEQALSVSPFPLTAQNIGLLLENIAQSKQSRNRRKFAQSGHPGADKQSDVLLFCVHSRL
jgi:hypothetical protein